MTNKESFLIGRALGLAEGGWSNDCGIIMNKNKKLFKGVKPSDEGNWCFEKPLLRLAFKQGLLLIGKDIDEAEEIS